MDSALEARELIKIKVLNNSEFTEKLVNYYDNWMWGVQAIGNKHSV